MFNKFSVKKALFTCVFALSQTVFAAEVMTVCPSVEMLKQFNGKYTHIMPIGFDQQSGVMQVSIALQQIFKDDDKVFGGYGSLMFTVSGMNDDPMLNDQEKVLAQLDKLQLESPTPYMHRPLKDIFVPICTYYVPGEAVKAIVMQFPEMKKPIKAKV